MRLIVRIRRYRANLFFCSRVCPNMQSLFWAHNLAAACKNKALPLNARNKTPFHAGKSDKRPQIYFLQVALKFELKSSFEVS